MDDNKNFISLQQLARLLHIPVLHLTFLIEKYNLKEKRKRSFFWIPFLLGCFLCLLNHTTRHKDRRACFINLVGIVLSTNAISDRLSALPPAFLRELLETIQPYINQIGSPKDRRYVTEVFKTIMVEDASVFRLDKRLAKIFQQIPGSNRVGLKLYTSLTVIGEEKVDVLIKPVRHSDAKHEGKAPQNKSLELRDRGWFSIPLFVKWKDASRSFISRVQKSFNPQIVKVYQGNTSWENKRFQEMNWDDYSQVELEVKPYKDSKGSIYRDKNKQVFTLRMVGKKKKDGDWWWYVYWFESDYGLSFNDIHQLYRQRWQIEETFKNIKQMFGGDHIRLRHATSIENDLLMKVILYLCVKGFLRHLMQCHRRSLAGYPLDNICQGFLGKELVKLIELIIAYPNLTRKKLKELSYSFMMGAYSQARAYSNKRSQFGRVVKKLQGIGC